MNIAEIPTYLPIDQAVDEFGADSATLRRDIAEGVVRAVRVGENIAVSVEDVASISDIPAPTEAMRGREIRAKEAVEKYRLRSQSTLSQWRARGVVDAITLKHRHVTYDEYTVAVAARIYHSEKQSTGIRYTRSDA
jgi:hypothetical protein